MDIKQKILVLDDFLVNGMHRWGIHLLRIALGIVFFWFGALKLTGDSPIRYIVEQSMPLFPVDQFMIVLGVWEVIIGLGLIFKFQLRIIFFLLWAQMAGTFMSLFTAPDLFFVNGNILKLTTEGEFVIKNIVLVASSLAIGGHELKKDTEV